MRKTFSTILASLILADAMLDTAVFGRPLGLFGEGLDATKSKHTDKKSHTTTSTNAVKSNFTDFEMGVVANNLPNGTSLSVNKCGNLAIRHKDAPSNIFFNIYKKDGGYIIRKRLSVAKGIKNVGGVMNDGKPFPTLADAMAYLNKYAEKYPSRMYSRAR